MRTNNVIPFALWLGAVAGHAQDRPPRAATTQNQFAGNPQAIADGKELYNRTCTGCHGYDGTPGEQGPGLGASGRRYLRISDREIFDAIQQGIPGTMMPGTGLAETDACKVAAYIRSLRGTAIDAPAQRHFAHGEPIFC